MLCRNPVSTAKGVFPCGKCEPCRFSRKALWKHRILLENLCHHYSSFITLTYRDEDLPRDDGIPVLMPVHLQAFLKRLRDRISPDKVRFYGVGEYGDKSDRPHYHIILFGFVGCLRGRTKRKDFSSEPDAVNCCDYCRLIYDSWSFGNVDLGTVTNDSASYIAKYTVKHMTAADDRRLNGRTPEFCRMSLRPGIGADAMWDIASDMLRENSMIGRSDVPMHLRHAGVSMPLGRYLRDCLRVRMGFDKGQSDEAKAEMEKELLALREDWNDFNEGKEGKDFVSWSKYLSLIDAGKYANLMAKFNLYRKDDKL